MEEQTVDLADMAIEDKCSFVNHRSTLHGLARQSNAVKDEFHENIKRITQSKLNKQVEL